MKNLIFIAIILIAACGESGNQKASPDLVSNPVSADDTTAVTENLPAMSFEKNIYDFGTINEGDEVKYSYKFTNTGNADLLISNAGASCGCTVPSWPKEPIKPGGTANIDVTFNSTGKGGKVEKSISIMANTRPTETFLIIKGEVKKKNNQ